MGNDIPSRPPPAAPADPALAEEDARALAIARQKKERRRRGVDSLRIEPGLSPASGDDTGLRIPY